MRGDEVEVAEDADIGLGVLLLEEPRLGGLDRAHDRGAAAGVLVDADAEVDLVAARVGGVKMPISSMILSGGVGFSVSNMRVPSLVGGQASIRLRSRRSTRRRVSRRTGSNPAFW